MKHVIFKDGSTAPVNNIYCIGRSYAEHISELGNVPTGEPLVFLKPTTALSTDDTLRLPNYSEDIHHEVELVIYIGEDVADDQTPDLSCILGYGIGLDLTARDVQSHLKAKGMPWTTAKGFRDGAWLSILTKGIPTTHQISLTVNGDIRQDDSTDKLLFDIAYQLNFLHEKFGLRQGDIVYTGTPKGVGRLVSGDTLIARLDAESYTIHIA
ncbi:fumarylacetoacetate hydrolase family protein [Moraxella canis]|uniref:Fumarylacetoacetate hydrolase n=1 Tax=Moraxella canis TaxID=90239 RepID=A0A1S9ZIC0_9GAMM|nr:fumarylacetoacetate hydrolase family protein [Moraxella canis]OOR83269.1 fumarylacetoacetate hydrolase [Moraxella canis]